MPVNLTVHDDRKRISDDPYYKTITNGDRISKHIDLIKWGELVRDSIKSLVDESIVSKTFLDVGGGTGGGAGGIAKNFGLKYTVMDISPPQGSVGVAGDICNLGGDMKNRKFGVVFSKNLLEHVKEPWTAVENKVELTENGGLIIIIAPFSWRYHPMPADNWRFSVAGLRELCARAGNIQELASGYDATKRRRDERGGKSHFNGLDIPPVDSDLGGWREQWLSVYVGKKHST